MTIKANIQRDAQGNIIVRMQGGLDYEYSIPLREELTQLISKHPEAMINIDMAGMDFVGSSGISHFVETIKIIHSNDSGKISLCNVNSEFRKVFKLFNLDEFELILDAIDIDGTDTRSLNTLYGNRKRTFEN